MSENGCRAKEKKRKRDIEGKGRKRRAVFKKGRGLWEGCGVNHHHSLTHTGGFIVWMLFICRALHCKHVIQKLVTLQNSNRSHHCK